MAPWGDAKLFFCILCITCCCTMTLAEVPVDCCLTVSNGKPIAKALIVDYRRQVAGQGCSIGAMILITKRDKKLCVVPEATWIPGVVKHVDHLRKVCKENYVEKRCKGVKLE